MKIKTDYIWNFDLIRRCDKGLNKSFKEYFNLSEIIFDSTVYNDLKENDLVWVKMDFISAFVHQVLPTLSVPIYLLISDGDGSFTSDCNQEDIQTLLNSDCIKHIFAQNNDSGSNKVTHIPIGLDYHTIAYKGNGQGGWGEVGTPEDQEKILNDIINRAQPIEKRYCKIFVDWHISDTMHASYQRYKQFKEDRKTIFHKLNDKLLVDYVSGFIRRSELWSHKSKYVFSVSPMGNGYDCHRTWEDLLLGCIVIVKSSPIDPLYEGLPVVIVKDWDEITKENLKKWLEEYKTICNDGVYRYKLTTEYWWNKIETVIRK